MPSIKNYIYNGDFRLALADDPSFPDGWERVGGDSSTKWEWLQASDGSRFVEIYHPSGPRAGIAQLFNTSVPAGDNQRWEVQVSLKTEPSGVLSYIRIYTGGREQKLFTLLPSSDMQTFSKVFATGTGTSGMRVEVGVLSAGTLIITEVKAYCLYPSHELRLDEKGQAYVKHVESIGQIQKPVAVQLVSPVPVPVSAQISVNTDVRNLTPQRDGVRVYGSNGNPLATTADGLTQVQIAGRRYQEHIENVTAQAIPSSTRIYDLAELSVYTFAVYNSGINPALVRLEISPNGTIWLPESDEQEVLAGSIRAFIPQVFLRYIRLTYRALAPTSLNIWFQSQI